MPPKEKTQWVVDTNNGLSAVREHVSTRPGGIHPKTLDQFRQMPAPPHATHVGFTAPVPGFPDQQVHAFFEIGRKITKTIHQKDASGLHRELSPDSRDVLKPRVHAGGQHFEMEIEEKEDKRRRAYQSLAVPPAPKRSKEQMERLAAVLGPPPPG